MEDDWRPLFADEDSTYDEPSEGIPQWLEASLWGWVRASISYRHTANHVTYVHVDRETLRAIERVCRVTIPYDGIDPDHAIAAIRRYFTTSQSLRLVDFLLSNKWGGADNLRTILEQAGSVWTIGERGGKSGLVRRVNEGTQLLIDSLSKGTSRAGKRVGEAYVSAFGINPNPEAAYGLAVKAVEDAAIPLVLPDNATARLGTVITRLRQTGLELPFQREHKFAPADEVLVKMLQTLQTGQSGRHGGTEGEHTEPVSQDAAEAAVALAATLVQWFISGAVQIP